MGEGEVLSKTTRSAKIRPFISISAHPHELLLGYGRQILLSDTHETVTLTVSDEVMVNGVGADCNGGKENLAVDLSFHFLSVKASASHSAHRDGDDLSLTLNAA